MKVYQVVNKEDGKRKHDYQTKTIYLRKHAAINRCTKGYKVIEYDLKNVIPTDVHES